MENPTVVYKRTPAWWVATCYLLGTLFLLLYGALSLVGFVANVGKATVEAVSASSQQQNVADITAAKIKDQIKLVSFSATPKNGRLVLTTGIKNDSSYAIDSIHIEIAYLDPNSVPVYTQSEWLHDLGTVYSGDTAYSHGDYSLHPDWEHMSYAVRITSFKVLDDAALKYACERLGQIKTDEK